MKKVTGGLYRQKCPNSDYGQEIAAERRKSVAPGASPGFSFDTISAPGRKSLSESFAPSGLRSRTTPTPGLRPGLHSVAAPRLNAAQVISPSSLRKFPRPQSQLGQICRCKEGMRFSSLQHYFSLFLSARRTSTWLRPERSLRLTRHGLRSSDVKSGTLDGGLR